MQNAHLPFFSLGPLPVSSTQPTSLRRARVLEDPQQLVDGVRAEGVEDVGPVERDPDRAVGPRPVVGQVGQVLEARDVVPLLGVEDLADALDRAHGGRT